MMKKVIIAIVLAAMWAGAAEAAQEPQPGKLDARVRSVTYQENNVVRIDATYGISTMVIFENDEKFETVSAGDTDSWQITPNKGGNLLFIKPMQKNVVTNLNVVTNKRVYFLELHDNAPAASKEIFGVRFSYPENEVNSALRKEAEYRAANPNQAGIDKANVNLDYTYKGGPKLKPAMIFDDGKKTFFKFRPNSRVPAIFSVNGDYTETLLNFRREGEYIVVDGTAQQFTLRDGSDWTCIFNDRKADLGAPDPAITGPVKDEKASKRMRSGN
nr:P-type conjugative transfer protein VirB9 [Allorhizobium ampelinum]